MHKVFKQTVGAEEIKWEWISYNSCTKKIHCYICLAYSADRNSPFVNGISTADVKHLYSRIHEHEKSKTHDRSVNSYIMAKKSLNLSSHFSISLSKLHDNAVLKNRHIMCCVIKAVIFLGKKGLPYRGTSNMEAAYNLADIGNHGNFLDVIKLIPCFDKDLASHLDNITKKAISKKGKIARQSVKTKTKRAKGSGNTFLSKATIETVYTVIAKMVKDTKLNEVLEAGGKYGILLDSTQDISVIDQVCIGIRYVLNEPKEHLLCVTPSLSGTGEGLFQLLKNTLEKNKIALADCIADSTDGAANVSGIYNGLQAKLKESVNNQVHVHCDAHALNLVVCDSCTSISALNLFGLVEKLAVFFRDSYKRMDVWRDMITKCQIGSAGQKRLQMISSTRWSSRGCALVRIFCVWQDPNASVYPIVIRCLTYLRNSEKQNSSTRTQAADLRDKLLSYGTILTAMVFLSIFRFLTPLSNYLQTAGMDYSQAWVQIERATLMLRQNNRNFGHVKMAADKFVEIVNTKLLQDDACKGVVVEDCFPNQRARTKKRMDGERAYDEIGKMDENKKFEVTVYNSTYDTTLESLEKRFAGHKNLYKDLSFLCPSKFAEIRREKIISLDGLMNIFGDHVTEPKSLKQELVDFAANWTSFRVRYLFTRK